MKTESARPWDDDARQLRKTGMNDEDFQPLVPTDDDVNSAALSWGTAPQPADGVTGGGLPCIQVAGVTVWLYRKDGVMQISVDTDDADGTTPGQRDADGGIIAVPMRVDVNGTTVWTADEGGSEGPVPLTIPAPHYHDATGTEDQPCWCTTPGTYAPGGGQGLTGPLPA